MHFFKRSSSKNNCLRNEIEIYVYICMPLCMSFCCCTCPHVLEVRYCLVFCIALYQNVMQNIKYIKLGEYGHVLITLNTC